MKIAIITSEDYYFAANTFLSLKQDFKDVCFVDVKGKKKGALWKKLKLAFLLGPYSIFTIVIKSFINRRRLCSSNSIVTIDKAFLIEELDKASYDFVFLINYPWKIKTLPNFPIFNCHPSLLPSFRGLTPIPHCLIDGWTSSEKPCFIGLTIHEINEEFDEGVCFYQKKYPISFFRSIFSAYEAIYGDCLIGIKDVVHANQSLHVLESGRYYKEMRFKECLRLKYVELLRSGFIYFMINGGSIGLFSWVLQLLLYYSTEFIDFPNAYRVTFSVWASFVVVMVINFITQKKLIFKRRGSFLRFGLSTTFLIFCVSVLSAFLYGLIEPLNVGYAEIFSYPLSALIFAPIAYYIKSKFVFK